jgi:hypothetical protein
VKSAPLAQSGRTVDPDGCLLLERAGMSEPAATYDSEPCGSRLLNLMDEDTPIDEISRIEAQLEELAEVSERCRKIILVSKAAIAGGVALLLFMMLGLFGSNQVAAIGSIAVVLGGIVSLGSNVSTLQQTMAAMSAAEVLRSDLISRIELRVVGDRRL